MVQSGLSRVTTCVVSILHECAGGLMGPRGAEDYPANHLPTALGEP